MKKILTFLLLLTAMTSLALAQRAIPDDNLALPVLINLTDCGSSITAVKGTGFFVDADSGFYLVTARHVLFNESQPVQPPSPRALLCKKAELLSYSKAPKDRQQNRLMVDLQALNEAGRIKGHASHDVAVVQIGLRSSPSPAGSPNQAASGTIDTLRGVQTVQVAPSGLLSTSISDLKKFDEVLAANDVYVLGYPSSIGIQQTPQIDYDAPLLRKGIVAGVNSANKTVVLDCLTFQGNSGGPVVEVTHEGLVSRFWIIGLVSQYVPVTETWVNTTLSYFNMQIHNSGYSVAEPMDPVIELIGK
jgi:hypothetical protein